MSAQRCPHDVTQQVVCAHAAHVAALQAEVQRLTMAEQARVKRELQVRAAHEEEVSLLRRLLTYAVDRAEGISPPRGAKQEEELKQAAAISPTLELAAAPGVPLSAPSLAPGPCTHAAIAVVPAVETAAASSIQAVSRATTGPAAAAAQCNARPQAQPDVPTSPRASLTRARPTFNVEDGPLPVMCRAIHDVSDLWLEWNIGWLGEAPRKEWRHDKNEKERNFARNRNVIINEIKHQAARRQQAPERIARRLEQHRIDEGLSLNSLAKSLKERYDAREAEKRKDKRRG